MFVKSAAALALAVPVLVAVPTAAGASPGASTKRPVASVVIRPVAMLADGGSLKARVRIMCQPNGHVWEAYLNAEQGAVESSTGISVTCDGRPHVENVEFVGDLAGAFERGKAIVQASVVDEDDFLTEYASDTRTVLVR